MTESEWQTTTSAVAEMFVVARRRAPARKLRLVATAACRLMWEHVADPRSRNAVLVCEQFADGFATEAALIAAEAEALAVMQQLIEDDDATPVAIQAAITAVAAVGHANPADALERCLLWVVEWGAGLAPTGQRKAARVAIRARLCDLFREVIGNVYRPWKSIAPFLGGGLLQPDGQPVHRSVVAMELARSIQQDQAFDRLPILADALEESGVTDPDLLLHCRSSPQRHVRGCWALDVALGRVP